MADIWLPGWPRHIFPNARGKPYQFTHNPKGCLHTTEGGSISGALGAYEPYPPHGIYDWRSRERLQHIPLNLASYSAMDGNDDDYMIQVELVGFAAETRTWPDEALRNIAADVVAPLEQYFRIPRNIVWHGFKDGRDGITLATESSPIRLTPAQLRDFTGWLGHQHLPSPDTHWDPGALPMARILSYLEDDMSWDETLTNAEGFKAPASAFLTYTNAAVNAQGAKVDKLMETVVGTGKTPALQTHVNFIVDELSRRTGVRFDELAARVSRLETSGVPVNVQVDYQALAKALADEQDRRARDNDHTTGPTT